jgi:hypothetical protein
MAIAESCLSVFAPEYLVTSCVYIILTPRIAVHTYSMDRKRELIDLPIFHPCIVKVSLQGHTICECTLSATGETDSERKQSGI